MVMATLLPPYACDDSVDDKLSALRSLQDDHGSTEDILISAEQMKGAVEVLPDTACEDLHLAGNA